MHVLHSFKDYYPPTVGGVEGHIHQIVNNLEGFEFTVLTSSRSRSTVRENLDGVEVIRAAEYLRPASTPIMPSWRSLLKQSNPDLIHAHMPNPFGEICLLTADSAPIVASYHADIIGRRLLRTLFSPVQQRFFRRAATIIVGSRRFADAAEVLRPHLNRVEVVPYGIDVSAWRERPAEADAIREKFPGPLVVFLGRLVHYKGLDVLVEAMTGVDATCLIIGDGPRREQVEEAIRAAGVEEKVKLAGHLAGPERRAYLHAADLFVLPSTSSAESYGISMLEAMACGTPAISTEVGTATSWVNQHLITGLVVEPSDPAALAQAIKELLASPALRAELGAAAAQRVQTEFSQERMLELMREVYEAAV